MTTFKLSNSTMDEASVLQHKMKRQKKPIQEGNIFNLLFMCVCVPLMHLFLILSIRC